MGFLSEDATYLAGGLGIVALVLLVAMRVTQQGKFLMWALGALGLAVLVLGIEQLWVTDAERIEGVVYDLRRGVANSDAPAVLALLTPEIEYVQWDRSISGESAREFIESQLERVHFDFVRITQLRTRAGRESRRGTAEFRVLASGSYQVSMVAYNFGTTDLDFSLGFRRVAPKVWRVDRISVTRAPRNMPGPGGPPRPRRPPPLPKAGP